LWGDNLALMRQSDFVAVNLECPVLETASPMAKTGPVLSAPMPALAGLARANVAAVSLANNHALDHGSSGLRQTLAACRQYNLLTFGAGLDLASARRLLVVRVKDIRVAFLGLAEREWSVATAKAAGANPMDPIGVVRQLREARETFDYLVVFLHAGAEFYPYPSPALQDYCRFLVEQGAHLVLCQHSHCLGCAERYGDGFILYGQGNLLFDGPRKPPAWQVGAWVEVQFNEDRAASIELRFFQQSIHGSGQQPLLGSERDAVTAAFAQRSAELADGNRVGARWSEFCARHGPDVLAEVLGHGPVLRRFTRRRGVVPLLYSPQTLRNAWNCVRCETHREMLLEAFDACLSQAATIPGAR
jgi:poly-gamma-glutamate capsule biosynthesis protein CapA/YwtB (metallophosphatase superfamily)